MVNSESLAHALAYAGRGWRVFPAHSFIDNICTCDNPNCSDPAKHPLNHNGCHGATVDTDLIRAWHEETQGLCNWAIATGEGSGLWVLDVDPRHGGDVTLETLERQHGLLPVTLAVATGGGGKQFFWRWAEGVKSRSGILPGLDTRGEGGYVIAPPSLHKSGQRYRLLTPPDTLLAEAPAWLLALVLSSKLKQEPDARGFAASISVSLGDGVSAGVGLTPRLTVGVGPADLTNSPGVGDGRRNDTLCRLVGVHLARGESFEQIKSLALAWAYKCDPPLDTSKTLDHVRRLWRKHHASTDNNTAPPADARPEPGREGTNSAPASGPGSSPGISSLSPQAPASSFCAGVGSVDPQPWPKLHADALYGLAGDIIKAIAPQTEADPVGVLLGVLTGVGIAVGRGPHFHAGGIHHANLFACLVGKTSAAKGTAVSSGLLPVQQADTAWAENCIGYGLGSGEGLVERVQDAQAETESVSDGDGKITGFKTSEVGAGAADKRLLIVEEEFAKVVTLLRRENSTLSQHVKNAWDGKPLEVMNRGKNKLKATEHHVGILATITPEELAHCFAKGTATKDGFANRFLWPLVKRSKSLPHGGNRSVLEPFIKPLTEALSKAKAIGQMKRSEDADRLWESHYERLMEAGDQVTACERARPQVLRLSMMYALLDGSAIIQVEHLKAALAVWAYCEASARLIFGGGLGSPSTPEPLAVRLLNAITASPGISRTGLRDVAGHKVKAEEIETALAWLKTQGLAHRGECGDGPGRRAECWWPGAESDQHEARGGAASLSTAVASGEQASSPGLKPHPDAGSEEREGGNSSPRPTPKPEAIASLHPPTPEQFAPSLPHSQEPEPEQKPMVNSLPPSPPMPLPELFAHVRAIGGRLVRRGGVISVEAEGITPEVEASVQAHQGDLLLLVAEAPPSSYADAQAVIRAVHAKGGQIIKDEQGRCVLHLLEPDADLEEGFARLYAEVCGEFYSDADAWRELQNML